MYALNAAKKASNVNKNDPQRWIFFSPSLPLRFSVVFSLYTLKSKLAAEKATEALQRSPFELRRL